MTTITHAELVAALKKPGADILESLTAEKADLWHMASCIPGEAGELFDAVWKNDRANVIEELGDVEFYMEGQRQAINVTREETLLEGGVGLGIADLPGQAGNLFDVVKKHIIYNKPLDGEAVVNAFDGMERVLAGIRNQFGITREETVDGNIAKLSKRYEGLKYSDGAAQARADKPAGE